MPEIDSRLARARADEQAERLAPRGVAPQFLAEAIWHRTLAIGSPPTDAEVVEYLARCAADHVPISGRQEHEPSIQPIERYRAPDGTVVVVERRARNSYAAVVVGDRERAIFGRSRARIHRDVEERWPGGTWSYTLAQRDRAEILRRWPEPPGDPNN